MPIDKDKANIVIPELAQFEVCTLDIGGIANQVKSKIGTCELSIVLGDKTLHLELGHKSIARDQAGIFVYRKGGIEKVSSRISPTYQAIKNTVIQHEGRFTIHETFFPEDLNITTPFT